jgi:hypothetical protein
MKKSISSLIAGMGLSLVAVAQEAPKIPSFWMTLSNKQRISIDCGTLANGRKTVGFYAQFEPYTEADIEKMTPQQRMWFKMSRESRSDDPQLNHNLAMHLETSHGVKRNEIEAAYQHCLTLQK